MLVKATSEDIEKYADRVYELAMDQSKSGYPTYTDGFKTKEDFLKDARESITGDSQEILLFFREDNMEGWVEYFWIAEEKYLQLSGCNINVATEEALAELLSLLEERFPGYAMYFGFPKANVNAVHFLQENGFTCIEEDYNNSFFFDTYQLLDENDKVVKVDALNFEEFREIHLTLEGEMYWTCDRIFENLDSWKIYLYYEGDKAVGTIFFTGQGDFLEIFGTEFIDGEFEKERFRALMVAALNEGKSMGAKYLTFFCEEREQDVVEELGFRPVGQYVCYKKELVK